jgi:poly(beta-D-mannuronate) lyase
LAIAWPSQADVHTAATRTVTSISGLQSALDSAVPGDVIVLADGSYSTSSTINISVAGTADAPITIQAEHVGGATISGSGGFGISSTASYVVLSGFRLTGSLGLTVPVGATHDRITRNLFQMAGSVQYWLRIAGDDAQVDHNTFQHKSTIGNFIEVIGPGTSGMAQRPWIHHNYFLDQSYTGSNGGESIRVGLSGRQHSSAHAIVEYNLFEQCNGDLEVISVKSSDDVIRYNTLRNSKGTITLRHGWSSVVEGNFLIGNSTGIRMFGNYHAVINNVIENSTGLALEIGGGEVRDDTTSGTNHEAVDHALVAFNTFVNDRSSPIQVGDGGKAYQPSDVTIADNIITGSGSAVSFEGGSGIKYQGNILYGVSGGAMPSSGYRTVNPQLVLDSHGLYRLSSGSPAIDAALGTFSQVTLDMDGQTRTGVFDVGADEYATSGTLHEPLTTSDVGPAAPDDGGNPGDGTTTRYEAESAMCDGTIDSDHAGFSGSGFCNTTNAVGASEQWSVNADSAGSATLRFRYADGASASRPMTLSVNGVAAGTLDFPPTASWDTWADATATVALASGANTVRLVATTSAGGPNLDYVEVS